MPSLTDYITQLVPAMQPLAQKFLDQAKQTFGYDFKITEAYRTNERQAQLYANGRGKFVYNGVTYPSQGSKIVTQSKPGESYHNQRRAFDIYETTKGYNVDWDKLGALGESLGLVWGGRFPVLVDRPHFEYHGPDVIPSEGTHMPLTPADAESFRVWLVSNLRVYRGKDEFPTVTFVTNDNHILVDILGVDPSKIIDLPYQADPQLLSDQLTAARVVPPQPSVPVLEQVTEPLYKIVG